MLTRIVVLLGVVGMLAGCWFDRNYRITRRDSLTLRVMSYNFYQGGSAQPAVTWHTGQRTSYGDRLEAIKAIVVQVEPDILIAQELQGWEENDAARLKQFGDDLGMVAVISDAFNGHRVGVFSRYPIEKTRELPDDTPFRNNFYTAKILLPGNREIRVSGVHFEWAQSPDWQKMTAAQQADCYRRQCDEILMRLEQRRENIYLVAGTLGQYPTQSLFDQTSLYRSITRLGYVDCLEQHNPYRYDKLRTASNGRVLDYILAAPFAKGACVDSGIVDTTEAFEASDHLPIWADFELK